MSTIGTISQAPVLPAIPKVAAAPTETIPVLHAQTEVVVPQPEVPGARSFEQQRFEGVQKAAEQIANPYVVGSRIFTLFKDATGQYVTRFRDLQTGKVTYIPEPELLKKSTGSLVNKLA